VKAAHKKVTERLFTEKEDLKKDYEAKLEKWRTKLREE